MSLFSLVWLCCSNDVSSAPNFWTTRINQKLWLNDRGWMIYLVGCNKFLSPFVFTVQTRKIGPVYSQENYRNCCHLMSDFKAKRHQNRFWLGLRATHPARGARSTPPDLQLAPSRLWALLASKQLASPNMYP